MTSERKPATPIELAKECGAVIAYVGLGAPFARFTEPKLSTLVQRVRDEAMEEAAKACEGECVDVSAPEDRAYNRATKHCAAAIRSLKAKP